MACAVHSFSNSLEGGLLVVRGFDFSREAFEDSLNRIVDENGLVGLYDVTMTMLDRGKRVSDRVYFIPLDSECHLVIYSTVDVLTDRSPVEATDRWDVELYWVLEGVNGTYHQIYCTLDRTYDLFEDLCGVIRDAKKVYDESDFDRKNGFSVGLPYM